jgi:hypothetical protein
MGLLTHAFLERKACRGMGSAVGRASVQEPKVGAGEVPHTLPVPEPSTVTGKEGGHGEELLICQPPSVLLWLSLFLPLTSSFLLC